MDINVALVVGIKTASAAAIIKVYKALGVDLTEEEVRAYPDNPEYEAYMESLEKIRKTLSDEEFFKKCKECPKGRSKIDLDIVIEGKKMNFRPFYNEEYFDYQSSVPIGRLIDEHWIAEVPFGIEIKNGSTLEEIAKVKDFLSEKFDPILKGCVLVFAQLC